MKISETLKARLSKDRPMTSSTLRIPVDVVESMKTIAPLRGFAGYQTLLNAYLSDGLRRDEAQFSTSAQARDLLAAKPENQNYMYEFQHYDWLTLQVRLLKSGCIENADLKHIAEELEDMANEAEAALISFVRQTMIHLCKLDFSRDQTPSNHWREKIANFRAEVDDRIVNSFMNEDKLAEIYAKAWKKVPSILAQSLTQDEFAKIPNQCPYSMGQIGVVSENGI